MTLEHCEHTIWSLRSVYHIMKNLTMARPQQNYGIATGQKMPIEKIEKKKQTFITVHLKGM